jgi:CAAX prenyl protease-like protein
MPANKEDPVPGALTAWLRTDAAVRVLPFALFMVFVAAGSLVPPPVPAAPGEWDARWIFAVRAIVAGAALVLLWPRFVELHRIRLTAADWLLAIAAGSAVLVIWVLLDQGWVAFDLGSGFDPRRHGSEAIDWPVTFFRLLGLAVVVPVAEELFWRSFLLRWLERQDFLAVTPGEVGVRSLLITSFLFALEHNQWLAGFIAGLVYGWLYIRTGKLWVPVLAHALTNGLLGAYILIERDWRFW